MRVLTGKFASHMPFFKRAAIAILICLAAGEFVLSTPLAARMLLKELQTDPPLSEAEVSALRNGPPGAIAILSAGWRLGSPEFGGQYGGETLDALSLERVRYGAYLSRKTGLPILVSGGLSELGNTSLAALMAETLFTDYGIRARWLESRSANTAENAIYSSELLKRDGITRVILVTHAWHMKRAEQAFAANGLSVKPAPTAFYDTRWSNLWNEMTPALGTLRMSGYAIHEIVGMAWYRLKYGY